MKLRHRNQAKELAAAIARGRELRELGQDPDQALEFLESAVQRFPQDPELRLLTATVLLALRPDDVAAEAIKAAELAPDDPATLMRAGHMLLRGDREAARACAARANELAEPDFVLMGGLDNLNGLLAAFAGEDELAEEKLRSAVEREPDSEPFVRNLAVFLAERGRLQEGAEVLDKALMHVERKDEIERMRDRMAAEAADS
jgi:tetratricopeptide (TPR) repeat protein